MIIALFFSRNISLSEWLSTGLFYREKLLYERYLNNRICKKIYWFTYGTDDSDLANKLKNNGELHENIEVFPMPSFFNFPLLKFIYPFFIPIIFYSQISNSDILKTNQMDGSWAAIIAKFVAKKPLILRTGYTLSIFLKKRNKSKLKILRAKLIERISYKYSDFSIVASNNDKEYILKNHNINPSEIKVIHNYVDTELFKNLNQERHKKFVFVGRLNEQKNLKSLISAIATNRELRLDIYGEGELKEDLIAYARRLKCNVHFKGTIDNKMLPKLLNEYVYFIITSYYEGMPKSLLEAMSCGCICLGTDVVGINEVISDGVNGFLSEGTSIKEIEELFNRIVKLKSSDLENIRNNAISHIESNFSLNDFVIKEVEVIRNLL